MAVDYEILEELEAIHETLENIQQNLEKQVNR